MSEKAIRMTAQLYEMRDAAKRILGERYKSHMVELGVILSMTARRDKKNPLSVAIDVAKNRGLQGMELMMVFAAAVELEEPSA